ncbi:TOMM system kinase/cyclase fusion protein [Pseudoalteromonas xiamenensis]|uniref:TOMM system kinase/cyclase fusion protein n=1 Tax=Pseudoalteromonas xiamenensis TaxID=882626 RepID=UPI0035E6ED42
MPYTQISDQYIKTSFLASNYTLLEKIGEGGFGKVYKAKQLNTDQFVAIKFLAIQPYSEEESKQRYIERFKRETMLSSKLHHPNIVRLLDQGQCNENLLYAVFEYVDGQSLRTFLTSNGPMSPLDAQDIMLQLLDALIHAHQHGIIHRDIKPANIMLSKGGARTHAKILDFGIGTLTQDSRHQEFNTLTLTQETLGTPSYSAPEQLRGEPATESTDLYVWGLLFLECLTGIPAVSGSSLASIYHKQLSDAQVPVPQALLGHPIAGLLRRVLHKNPNDRVITGEEAYQELTRMNMANLVGALGTFRAVNVPNESTVILRDDEPNYPLHSDYTFFTERKQITVLAVRFSIALIPGSDSDLDVLDALFKSHRGHCLDIATRFGAYHVGSLGDTSLFYFGYPTASDNDTRLCARTALEVMSDLAKRNALVKDSQGAELSMHAGIHSGIFTTYANSTPEGHIANAALALARQAENNQILCSREARNLLEPYTEFDAHDDLQLGLTSATDPVFNLVGERRIEAFGFMRGTRNNHELIGRDVELEQTLSMFKGLSQSSNIAHIFGEAGIGKSRLLQEIRKNASGYQHLVAQCLPEHQNNALYPILNLVRYLYNTPQLSSEKAIALFSDILAENTPSLDVENALPILMIWLNIEFGEELTASTLAPDQQKSILFTSLTALLSSKYHSISEKKLYIVEDIHWADTTTLEFVQHFAKTLKQGDVLLSTSRQALPSQLNDLTLLEVGLKKLTEQATEDFIVKLFDERRVARNVLDVLINRTDGIPLFIEELVDMIKQKELVSVIAGEINFASPDKLEQVPSSLRESLQQKLDSLVYAKETAQLAATIGREFEYDLLVAASSLSENQIQNDLNELVSKDLIVHQRHVSNDSYIFKHALVRDAAYDSMVSEDKIHTHINIAGTLCSLKKLPLQDRHLSAGWHFVQAKEPIRALDSYNSVLKFYVSHSLNSKTNEVYSIVKGIADEFPNQVELSPSYLESLTFVLTAYMSLYGYAGLETIALASDIQKSLDKIEVSRQQEEHILNVLEQVQWAQFLAFHYSSQRKAARELGEIILADCQNNLPKTCCTLVHLAQAYAFDGDYLQSKEAYDVVVNNATRIENIPDVVTKFGSEPYSQGLTMCSIVELMIGNIKQSFCRAELGLTVSLHSKHDISITFAYIFIALHYFCLNDKYGVLETYQRYSKDVEHDVWAKAFLDILHDWANNQYDTALSIRKAMLESGQSFALGVYETSIADTLITRGEFEKARVLMEDAIARVESLDEVYAVPLLKRYLAKSIALEGHDPALAEALYVQAAMQAQEQQATFKEFNCVIELVEFFPTQNRLARLGELYEKLKDESASYYFEKAKGLLESRCI